MQKDDRETRERLLNFLGKALPRKPNAERDQLVDALTRAGLRYDHYMQCVNQWKYYSKRRKNLFEIWNASRSLIESLNGLDPISRNDIEQKMGHDKTESLQFLLARLHDEVITVVKSLQTRGTPRNIAEERWIFEIADIYEQAFSTQSKPRAASVWGPRVSARHDRGPFYELLKLSVPSSFPRHGKLDPAHVTRVLKRRN